MTTPAPRRSARIAVACASLCTLAFVALAILVVSDQLTSIDTRDILAVRRLDAPAVTTVMLAATHVAGGWLAVVLALLIAALIDRAASRRDAVLYAAACLSGEVLHLAIKALIHHHRPVGISPKMTAAGWYSFPSGHTMLAVIIFGLGAFLATRRSSPGVRAAALLVAAVVILLVGVSRVYLGAHWPSDVVGALCAGTAWSAASLAWAEPALRARESRVASREEEGRGHQGQSP